MAIKEETVNFNLSDDEVLNTPNNESKDKSTSIGGSNKIGKNPTYARITHASKQMEFLGHMRLGSTTMIGHRNDYNYHNGGGLMKSMPNFDFLKQQEKMINNSLPFNDMNGTINHSNTIDVHNISSSNFNE